MYIIFDGTEDGPVRLPCQRSIVCLGRNASQITRAADELKEGRMVLIQVMNVEKQVHGDRARELSKLVEVGFVARFCRDAARGGEGLDGARVVQIQRESHRDRACIPPPDPRELVLI